MNVAFVYDRVNKMGGAERVLTTLHDLWPDAPLYTAVYDPKRAPWARSFTVYTTFLQHIPFARVHHEWLAWITPFAFSTCTFDQYDVVISVTSAESKGIITKPSTCHISYCLTPTRYLWSGKDIYTQHTGFGFMHQPVKQIFTWWLPVLRTWDKVAAIRPDYYIAISSLVEERIKTYYHRKADTRIYPPVDTDLFRPVQKSGRGDYYLIVSRLVSYKRVDIVVEACTRLHVPLVVIGDGSDKNRLKRLAGPTVRFISDHLTDQALVGYYQQCRAFLFAGEEDFGIVAAEAQACGKPVIAYKKSGMADIIRDGVTGILFARQSYSDLMDAIDKFEHMQWSVRKIRSSAMRFRKEAFQQAMCKFVTKAVYLNTNL